MPIYYTKHNENLCRSLLSSQGSQTVGLTCSTQIECFVAETPQLTMTPLHLHLNSLGLLQASTTFSLNGNSERYWLFVELGMQKQQKKSLFQWCFGHITGLTLLICSVVH